MSVQLVSKALEFDQDEVDIELLEKALRSLVMQVHLEVWRSAQLYRLSEDVLTATLADWFLFERHGKVPSASVLRLQGRSAVLDIGDDDFRSVVKKSLVAADVKKHASRDGQNAVTSPAAPSLTQTVAQKPSFPNRAETQERGGAGRS